MFPLLPIAVAGYLVVAPAAAGPVVEVAGPSEVTHPSGAAVVPDPDDDPGPTSGPPPSLILLYAGEHDGRLGPCGCDGWPRGGLPALATAAAEVEARADRDGVPTLLLNPGGWLASASEFGELAPAAVAANTRLHRALYELRFDVLNTSFRDLPSVGTAPHPGLVSATHRLEALAVAKYKRFELDGLDVLVTGVSRDGLPYLQPEGTVVQPPVEAVRALLAVVDADLVVVLAHDVAREVPAIAAIPGVDVVIDAADHGERWPPEVVGDAVWVRSVAAGGAMGELRLWVQDGAVTRAVERAVSLGPDVPPDPRLQALIDADPPPARRSPRTGRDRW